MLLAKNLSATCYVCLADFKDPPTLLESVLFGFLNVSQENHRISLHCLCSLDSCMSVYQKNMLLFYQAYARFHLVN